MSIFLHSCPSHLSPGRRRIGRRPFGIAFPHHRRQSWTLFQTTVLRLSNISGVQELSQNWLKNVWSGRQVTSVNLTESAFIARPCGTETESCFSRRLSGWWKWCMHPWWNFTPKVTDTRRCRMLSYTKFADTWRCRQLPYTKITDAGRCRRLPYTKVTDTCGYRRVPCTEFANFGGCWHVPCVRGLTVSVVIRQISHDYGKIMSLLRYSSHGKEAYH